MDKELRILLVEDSIDDVALIEHLLKKEGLSFTSRVVETKEDYQKQLLEFRPDVVISDHSLPQFNSMEALNLFLEFRKQHDHAAAFVLVTGTVSEEFAVKAIQSGADDYILKDRLKRLPTAILSAVEKIRLRQQRKKEEEEKLQLLDILQKSLNEIYVFDPNTMLFEYINTEALKNLGYTVEEVLKMTPADLLFDFEEDRFRKILSNVEKSAKGRIYERYVVRKNRTRYPIQIHLQMIEHGGRKKILANVLDITQTKEYQQQKELALFIQNCFNEDRSLHTSLRFILKELCQKHELPVAEVWSRDFEGTAVKRYSFWCEKGQVPGKIGSILAEMAFKTGKPVFSNALNEEEMRENAGILKEEPFRGVMAHPIKSGDETSAVIVAYTQEIRNERDPFINLKEGVQDKLASNIKRKKTEEELQKIFEFSPDILAIIGQDGYVKKINPALQKILGYSSEEITSRPFAELLHPDDMHTLEDLASRELAENETAHFENRYITSGGDYKWFAWSVSPFLKEGLQFAVGKDITEYKEQVKAIKVQNNRLAEIAWEQSHTVRAPLTRLMACIAYLEEFDENREQILTSIKASAHELDDIVKGIVNRTERVKQYEEY